jgi:outer-membrane receptor for ferric coprogen and ferric-rhodotorulic acid
MTRHLIALCSGVAICAIAAGAHAEEANPADQIVVTGSAATQQTGSATGLALSLIDTPQAVTVVNQQQIKDFALTNVNDLLDHVPAVNVERNETDRTEYDARGFQITSFQVDGIGLPLVDSGISYGQIDTALWDKVEVVRGANGMMTGVGNPSATVNYVRKRPTDTFEASLTASLGSYNDHRVEADIGGPITHDGTVRARLIVAHEDSDSYLDYYHQNRFVLGLLLAWDITPGLTLTTGYTHQQNDDRGVMWGALPLSNANAQQISYPVSASTAAPWTYWNTLSQSAFGELKYDLGHDWTVKGVYTHNETKYQSALLYASGYADPDTGLGVTGIAGQYPSTYNQNIVDFYASGPFELFGRKHQAAFGASYGVTSTREYEADSVTGDEIDYPAVSQIGQVAIPEPAFGAPYLGAAIIDRLARVYGAIHWSLTDRLTGITGFAATWLDSTGQSYGVDEGRKNSRVTPYFGAMYDVTGNVHVYANYTGIFNPQAYVDANNVRLAPATGQSVEGGIKSDWFHGRLYVAASLFHAKQDNLAEAAGTFIDGPGPVGETYYTGQTTISKGFELELAGKVAPNWTISGGYTGFSLKTPDGARAFTYLPNRTLKLSTTYTVPELHDLKLGAQMRWQNATSYDDSGVQDANGNDAVIRQGQYAVLDLMAGAKVVDHVHASINLRNVTNKAYLNSLAWGQAYYAAPRTVMGTLSFTY